MTWNSSVSVGLASHRSPRLLTTAGGALDDEFPCETVNNQSAKRSGGQVRQSVKRSAGQVGQVRQSQIENRK